MRYFLWGILLIFLSCQTSKLQPVLIKQTIDQNWQFRQVDKDEWLPAEVPGCVHTDLLINKKIEDPYYRINEWDQQWIDKEDWEYKTRFKVDPTLLSKDEVELSFKGLDTYADVFLNSHLILKSDNMFREWQVHCKEFLKEGENELKIYFHSPIQVNLKKYDALDYVLPLTDNDQSELGGLGEKRVSIFSRKAGYHFGWDWGPRFVTSGIWRPVELIAWDSAKLRDVHIKQTSLNDQIARLSANIQFESKFNQNLNISIVINDKKIKSDTFNAAAGMNRCDMLFSIKDPKRWWPNGLGDQTLYTIDIQLEKDNQLLDNISKRIGLRTVEVIRKPDEVGNSFYFKVNGLPVFMKGANYIPQDNFVTRVTPQRYEHVLQSAVDANMNMIRVWGGGIYENDIFYNLCDEMGLLVWQDFMFACSMYPGDEAFLQNVTQEAIDNVKRLRHHPSIALWCGNNENLAGWYQWSWKDDLTKKYPQSVIDEIWRAYQVKFHQILPEVVNTYDPDRLYWDSSPCADLGVPPNYESGDMHYWGVWWGKEPFSSYNEYIPRFMSEFGFQSFPEFKTVKSYTRPEDWDIYSKVMKSHQRSSIGNETIEEYMLRDFMPPKDFQSYLYVSQVLQAEGVGLGLEAHRRHMPYCMGSLFWQINDCWPVASWSSMDYYGRWKALMYYTKRAFKEIIVSPFVEDGQLDIYVVSDLLKNKNATLQLSIMDFKGNVLWEYSEEILIKANTSEIHFKKELQQLLEAFDPDDIVLVSQLTEGKQVLASKLYYFNATKNLNLPDPKIKTGFRTVRNGVVIEVKSDALARHVCLSNDSVDGFYSDNYFDLLPGEKKEITLQTNSDLKSVKEGLVVRSIVDSF